jgi:ABC-2 type transport system ATP-binding protein
MFPFSVIKYICKFYLKKEVLKMGNPVLEIKNYSKSYSKGKKAADNVSLTVESGDIYGFIGHNGAGKSTTIRAVVGVLDFEEGEIYIDGHSVKNEPIECKRITAYIPDNPDLYENMTGIQYLNFIADVFDISAEERKERIKKYADMLEISGSLGDLISSYSHGMKQKLAVISALIHNPKLLVLDEPFVGLDPKASFLLKEIMRDMCKQGTAVFFSTHVLDVAEKLCNKIAIIKQGRIIAAGDIEEVTEGQSLEEAFLEADNEE